MIDINKEAEEYSEIQKMEGFDSQMRKETFTRYSLNEAFTAGHNSKATQAKIIQGQIDVLKEYFTFYEITDIGKQILNKLEQQLEDLENGTINR